MTKLGLIVSEDGYLVSHRLALVRAAVEAGYEVVVVTRIGAHAECIRDQGARVVNVDFARGQVSLWSNLGAILKLRRVYSRERLDIVHHIALKPIVLGTVAATLTDVPLVINGVAGMGSAFVDRSQRRRWLRPLLSWVLRWSLSRRRAVCIVQNPDDRALLRDLGTATQRMVLIPGAGVDVAHFQPLPPPNGALCVAMVTRMLWDKGVQEFVEAASIVRAGGSDIRFVLVGAPDVQNPTAVPQTKLKAWAEQGFIEWWGHISDVRSVWRQAAIAVLPSYREGLPKALLEAAACARAIVTTDVPGCREVVNDGENGLLVPVRNAQALALAIQRLAADADLRVRMGLAGRRRVERLYSTTTINAQTLAVYNGQLP